MKKKVPRWLNILNWIAFVLGIIAISFLLFAIVKELLMMLGFIK